MNTQHTSELFNLHMLLNYPISYEDSDLTRDGAESAEDPTDPLAWLFKAFDFIQSVQSKRRISIRRQLRSNFAEE